jgi:hypothetical protein
MRRVYRRAVATAVILLVISAIWLYRVQAAAEAVEFQPARKPCNLLPAGTPIEAVLFGRIASSAVAGETVTAFVSRPVICNRAIVIAPGAQLTGHLEKLSLSGGEGEARLRFYLLITPAGHFPIRTRPINLNVPVENDVEILSSSTKTLIGATLGAALGAASGDLRMIERGMRVTLSGSISPETTVPFEVFLASELNDLKI